MGLPMRGTPPVPIAPPMQPAAPTLPMTMQPTADPLAQLRGIHVPADPHWWPPAPGWWLLAALLSLALWWSLRWMLRRHRRKAPWRAARRELAALTGHHADNRDDPDNDGAYLRELSVLLRRVALSCYPARDIAALTGDEWLAWLDRQADSDQFSKGPGRVLADGPYAPQVSDGIDVAALHDLSMRLLKRLCKV